jgi:hypothetical protein
MTGALRVNFLKKKLKFRDNLADIRNGVLSPGSGLSAAFRNHEDGALVGKDAREDYQGG